VTRVVVGHVSEIPPGERKIVHPNAGPGIGVFNVAGRFYALKNSCPHMGAPLCEGTLTGTTRPRVADDGSLDADWDRDGEIVGCPWHHWEFDVTTGRSVFHSRNRVATYPVAVEDGLVVVDLSRRR
jgi:nitrite reductase (NADH) small subunit